MTVEVILDEKLILPNLKASDANEVMEELACKLKAEGYVKEGYIEAIQEREKEYPTGLPSSAPAIAIPHANYELVNKTALAIATLNKPVLFYNMEDTNESIPIQIVIMMAIAEPHGQIEMLQKIVSIIQDESLRKQLVKATDRQKIIELISGKIQ